LRISQQTLDQYSSGFDHSAIFVYQSYEETHKAAVEENLRKNSKQQQASAGFELPTSRTASKSVIHLATALGSAVGVLFQKKKQLSFLKHSESVSYLED
jgi:sorbitol-specific phosphotransferase system component IIBC